MKTQELVPSGLAGILLFSALLFTLVCAPQSGHAATRVWDGGGINGFWSTATNWVGDVAPLAGDDLEFPAGASRLFNTNTFPPGTQFNSIRISGVGYALEGANILLNAGINATNTASDNSCFIPLTLNSNQTLTSGNNSVNLYVSGDIDTNGKELTFAGNGGAQVSAAIHGAGGLVKTGSGYASLYASNTFSGPLQILQGSVAIYHGNALGATNGGTTVTNGTTLSLVSALTVPEPLILYGTLNAANQPKVLTGPITLAATNVTIQVGSGSPVTINAVISGSGGFTKTSSDALTLNSNNTYTGTTTLSAGTLRINGSQPDSPIAFLGGTLGGTGTVGTITAGGAAGKTLAPGGSPGILTCSNVTLAVLVIFQVELNGTTAGSGYDQLNVNGSVTLGNALLSVTPAFTPAHGQSFVIINNDGVDAISGTFNNLPQDSLITNGATVLRVSYTGGDGNDVTLTQISGNSSPKLAIELLSADSLRVLWPTNDAAGFGLRSSIDLAGTNWSAVTPSPVVVGTNHVVTNTITGTAQYYRLFKP